MLNEFTFLDQLAPRPSAWSYRRAGGDLRAQRAEGNIGDGSTDFSQVPFCGQHQAAAPSRRDAPREPRPVLQIGRGSGRERVKISGEAGPLKKKGRVARKGSVDAEMNKRVCGPRASARGAT